MCGRFTFTPEPSEILTAFPDLVLPDGVIPRYNIAPTDEVVAVTARPSSGKALEMLKWGLIPSWARDTKIGSSLINARADSLQSKPAFRNAFKKRRCLVLADGFYEWRKEGSRRRPFYFKLASEKMFAFAGVWEVWKGPAGYVLSCAIITTEPNRLVGETHDRMPAILPASEYDTWLTAADEARAQSLLTPYPADGMIVYEVAPLVNSPRNDSPACVAPLGPPEG